MTSNIPDGWHRPAHQHWLNGKRMEAIQETVSCINTTGANKPLPIVLQFAYYLFMINDFQSAATVLRDQLHRTPAHSEVALNLAVCCSRIGEYDEAVRHANAVLTLEPENTVALDVLAKCHYQSGNFGDASNAGTQSLVIRDRQCAAIVGDWHLPRQSPAQYAGSPEKRHVIAFSLWGRNPRYLRGALHNALLARTLFPGWCLRFYVDQEVPAAVVDFLRKSGADVIVSTEATTTRQKLCWRFQVANDPTVGYFLVRDTDSVFSVREKAAVDAWLASDCWFHVIRDWWTHSELILAGLWGGVAGVLPSLDAMASTYHPGRIETPNIDQWFLRDKVWPYVRESCLVHDRCFRMPNSLSPPGPAPAGNTHIGQDEFAVRRMAQEERLRPLLEQAPGLAQALSLE